MPPTHEIKQTLDVTMIGKVVTSQGLTPQNIDSQIYVNNQLQENKVEYNEGVWQIKLSELESVKAEDNLRITFTSNGETGTYTTIVIVFPIIDAEIITLQ